MSISVILSWRTAMPRTARGWPFSATRNPGGAVDEHRVGEARQSREAAGLGSYVRSADDQPGGTQRAGPCVRAEHHGRIEDREQALEVIPAGGGQEGLGHVALPGGIGRGRDRSAAKLVPGAAGRLLGGSRRTVQDGPDLLERDGEYVVQDEGESAGGSVSRTTSSAGPTESASTA